MKTFLSYTLSLLFIASWWTLAFHNSSLAISTATVTAPLRDERIRPTKRVDLIAALAGNQGLMARLIVDWDDEAKRLEESGIAGIQRLSDEEFHRAFAYLFHHTRENSKKRYLPQTYASASFLLAMLDPEQLVALPSGFRNRTELFPETLMQRIPYDVSRFNTEMLSLVKPEAAFITTYSSPATLDMLRQQGVPTIFLNDGNSMEEIIGTIESVGTHTGCEDKACLLALFFRAALHAFDNRSLLLADQTGGMPRFLLVYDFTNFRLPTVKTLPGQILKRMNASIDLIEDSTIWSIPLSHEQIIQHNPDRLIIATEDPKKSAEMIRQNPLLSSKEVRFVDSRIQLSPDQFIIVAYFDILEALSG